MASAISFLNVRIFFYRTQICADHRDARQGLLNNNKASICVFISVHLRPILEFMPLAEISDSAESP
jgi:hypothetical protein